MKNLLLSFVLLLAISCKAQETGIHAGPNRSYFSGGDKEFAGIKHSYTGAKVGVWHKYRHNELFGLQYEVNYESLGAKNPQEQTVFKMHSLNIPVSLVMYTGDFTFQAGAYYNRLLRAENYTWNGYRTHKWKIKDWDYVHKDTYGYVLGAGYNLYGMYVEAHYMKSLRELRNWPINDPKMMGNKDARFTLSLYMPFWFIFDSNRKTERDIRYYKNRGRLVYKKDKGVRLWNSALTNPQ